MREQFIYEIFPVNFVMLPDSKQDETVEAFKRFLNGLDCPVKIIIMHTSKTVEIGDRSFETKYYRFFIKSERPIDTLLQSANMRFQPLINLPPLRIVKSFTKYLALEGDQLAKAATVIWLPGMLVEGFIAETYGVADRVVISIKPIPPEQATVKFRKYLRILRGMILADQSKGRLPSDELIIKKDKAQAVFTNLLSGATRLFEVSLNFLVSAPDLPRLKAKFKRLKDILQARLIRLDTPSFIQSALASGDLGKKLIVDTPTLGTFFPFVSADVVESPNGIFLGVNRLTGAPVIYDSSLRMNYNMLIAGKSGSGKSFLSKIIITRFLSKHPKAALFVIDPENEYRPVGELQEAEVIDVSRAQPLGLDPLQLFGESRDSAASILAELAQVREPELLSEIRTLVGLSSTVREVYKQASKPLKAYLKTFIKGPEKFLVSGKAPKFSSRMVFNLSPLHREFALTKTGTPTLQAASILLFSKIWQLLDDPSFLPRHLPKLVVIDEVWLYTSMPAAAQFLESVARRGRKRNIFFVLNTQRVADVLESSGGRALIENCATKVLLRQDESAIGLISEVFALSTSEREALLEFAPGQGILIAENVHVPVNFVATPTEYQLFTTRPSDVPSTARRRRG